MSFDPNSVPMDLRPINVAPGVAEEPRIVTTSAHPIEPPFYNPNPNPSPSPVRFDVNSPPPMPLYYTDSPGYPNLGFVNPGAPNAWWPPRMPAHMGPPPLSSSGSVSSSGHVYSPSLGTRVGGGSGSGSAALDQVSEDGGDDSVSGKKVKFLCSFGGKILPRPSDGMLRYVGGQTRIISARRNVSFGELVQKMVDTYGQPVVIKYQLPDEDLDALVSVSCPDDLDNMMEEYEKLRERSPDGSAKLRVFLFSASDPDPSGLVQLGGSHETGQRYVDAVNGVAEGIVGGITRKESIASVASTQNSDVSGSDVFETTTVQDVNGPPSSSMFSPRSDSEISAPPLVVPAGMSPHPASSQLETEPERVPMPAHGQHQPPPLGYELQQPGMNFQPYVGGYIDPHQDGLSLGASQVVYANRRVLGAPRPMLIHPQYRDNPHQQFVPAVQMTMAPTSSHLSMNPNILQPVVQPSHTIVAVPAESGYSNAFQTPVGGSYGWPQAPPQDPASFSEGYMPHQHVVTTTADCYMCQKALPHAHSDSIVQDQKVSQSPNVSDTNPIHQSLLLDDVSKLYAAVPHNQIGLVTDAQPYGGVGGNVPVSSPEDAIQPHLLTSASSQLQNESPMSKPVNSDNAGGVAYHAHEQFIPEISNVPGIIYRDDGVRSAIPNDLVTPGDFKRENLQSDNLSGNEQGKLPVGQLRKDDMFEHMPSQTMGREVLPNADTVGLHSNALPTTSPHNWDTIGNDSANSLFSNRDPWNMRQENHFPPPKPNKIAAKREGFTIDNRLNGELNADTNFADVLLTSEQVQAGKSSSEERIKELLQATAEGVAASVLQSSVSSYETNISEANHEIEGQTNSDAVIQTKMEAMNIKSDKVNFGLPLSDDLGRLQIIKNSDLEELRELGSGTFGTVYHGKWRGTDVAIKRINNRCFAGKPCEEERMRDDFWNEAIKLADLHHPNVVAFYGVVLDGPSGSVATVTEYMVNGSLRTALEKNERILDKRKRLLIAMDVAFGMEYLHSKNIVHFDLKSDNLLVNLRDPHRPICKVGDLGLSKVKCQTLISGGVRGTLPWMAPELLNGSSSLVSEKVDVFSFGIVMWELLTGEEPYADLHYGAIIGGIVSNTLRPAVPENCDPEWRSLMERCWSAEPSERPMFTEIANELRCMASKVPVKGQTPATTTRTNS